MSSSNWQDHALPVLPDNIRNGLSVSLLSMALTLVDARFQYSFVLRDVLAS